MRGVIVLITLTIAASSAAFHIDGTQTRFGGYYYKLFRMKATFAEAEDLCVSLGGHVASIHSKEENDFIYELTTGGRHYWESDHAWIGLKRKVLLFNKLNSRSRHVDDMDKWVWTDGTPVIYTNWDKKQPDNWYGEEACTHVRTCDTSNLTGTTKINKRKCKMISLKPTNAIVSTNEMFNHDTDPAAKRWNDVRCNKRMSSFVCKFKTPRN